MSRNKVFMNGPLLKDEHGRNMRDLLDFHLGIRPLDGTNLAWIYKREEKKNRKKKR